MAFMRCSFNRLRVCNNFTIYKMKNNRKLSVWSTDCLLLDLDRKVTIPLCSLKRAYSSDSTQDVGKSKPVLIQNEQSTAYDLGAEITGVSKRQWDKAELLNILTEFYRRDTIRSLAAGRGIDSELFALVVTDFKQWILGDEILPVELHIVINDLLLGSGHVDNLFPYFLHYVTSQHPELQYMDEIARISDLSRPTLWYPEARQRRRRIIYHAGPTNSGKTYAAMRSFLSSKSGIYCGPLRLLATEIFDTANNAGTSCDLVTGDDKRMVSEDGTDASHLACTVEMSNLHKHYEVAVIDEIQMMGNKDRGWAWTRALLGLVADEVHVCGDDTCIDLVRELAGDMHDDFSVQHYERLVPLHVADEALEDLTRVVPGDCIICFSKSDIHSVNRVLNRNNISTSVIYGSLPAVTKRSEAQVFNRGTRVLVATDAIGMGLNLNISRIIFNSMQKYKGRKQRLEEVKSSNTDYVKNGTDEGSFENGEATANGIDPVAAVESKSNNMFTISASLCKQIAGRAGRYGKGLDSGTVTTLHAKDLPTLADKMATNIPPTQTAGLNPTADQVELMSFYLPNCSLSQILTKFEECVKLDNEKYFICDLEETKKLADLIESVSLPLRIRYVYSTAPVSAQSQFLKTIYYKIAKLHGQGEPVTFTWLAEKLSLPAYPARTFAELTRLENVFEITELYLWLSYRFPEIMVDAIAVRNSQKDINNCLRKSLDNLSSLSSSPESSDVGALNFNPDILSARAVTWMDNVKKYRANEWFPVSAISKTIYKKNPHLLEVQGTMVRLRPRSDAILPRNDARRVREALRRYDQQSFASQRSENRTPCFDWEDVLLELVFDKLVRLQLEESGLVEEIEGFSDDFPDSDCDFSVKNLGVTRFEPEYKRYSDFISHVSSQNTTHSNSSGNSSENKQTPNADMKLLSNEPDRGFVDYIKDNSKAEETSASIFRQVEQTSGSIGPHLRSDSSKPFIQMSVENGTENSSNNTKLPGVFSWFINGKTPVQKVSGHSILNGSSTGKSFTPVSTLTGESPAITQTTFNSRPSQDKLKDTCEETLPVSSTLDDVTNSTEAIPDNSTRTCDVIMTSETLPDQLIPIQELALFARATSILARQNVPLVTNFRVYLLTFPDLFRVEGDYVRRSGNEMVEDILMRAIRQTCEGGSRLFLFDAEKLFLVKSHLATKHRVKKKYGSNPYT